MGAGRFPTTEWRTWVTNPVVVSEFPLQIPPGTPPGEYTLLAGAYDAKTVTPLVQPGKWEPWVPLARVVVQP